MACEPGAGHPIWMEVIQDLGLMSSVTQKCFRMPLQLLHAMPRLPRVATLQAGSSMSCLNSEIMTINQTSHGPGASLIDMVTGSLIRRAGLRQSLVLPVVPDLL